MATTLVARLAVTTMIALGALAWWPAGVTAQETIRIGCPTKTYFPTILATVAKEKGLFEKEGLRPEITIYRGGGETFEAIAANSADLGPVAVPLVATSRKRGVLTKIVGGNGDEWSGWILGVKTGSAIKSAKELDGKKVGITSAGSGTDTLALWAQSEAKATFQRVGVGGGGLVPNLLNDNLAAAVIYSPLSYQVVSEGKVRVLIDFATAMPPNLIGGWAATGQLKSAAKSTYQPSYSIFIWLAPLHESADEFISIVVIMCRACMPNIVLRSPVSRPMVVIVTVPPFLVGPEGGGSATVSPLGVCSVMV